MERIIDIYGHYAQYDDFYHLDDSFIGRAVLHEDNTFDGVAKSFDGDETFVLVGNVGKGFINTYVTGGNDQYPHLYKGIEESKDKYYGSCYATDGCLDLAIGEVKLTVMDADKTRETTEGEINDILNGVEIVKGKLSEKQLGFYETIIEYNYSKEKKVK